MIGKISFWIKLPIGYFLIWDTHRQKPGRVLTEPDRLSSLSRTGSSPSRTGFELRSTILPLHRSRPLGKFPTTISYRNGVKASHGGSSLSRTGLPSMSRAGLFLASLRGGLHGPSMSRTGFELRSTIPWRVLTEPDRLVLSQRNFSVSGFCFYV